MASNTPPRFTGPAADTERARRYNDPLTDRALTDEQGRYRVYRVTVVAATDLVVRHDLREALIPTLQAVGAANVVSLVSYAVGQATLRVTAGTTCECLVRFERLTQPQPR